MGSLLQRDAKKRSGRECLLEERWWNWSATPEPATERRYGCPLPKCWRVWRVAGWVTVALPVGDWYVNLWKIGGSPVRVLPFACCLLATEQSADHRSPLWFSRN